MNKYRAISGVCLLGSAFLFYSAFCLVQCGDSHCPWQKSAYAQNITVDVPTDYNNLWSGRNSPEFYTTTPGANVTIVTRVVTGGGH